MAVDQAKIIFIFYVKAMVLMKEDHRFNIKNEKSDGIDEGRPPMVVPHQRRPSRRHQDSNYFKKNLVSFSLPMGPWMPNHGGTCPNTLQILRQDVPTTLKDGFRCCRTFSYFHFGDDRRISTRATGDDGYFFRTWKPNKSFVSMAVRGDVDSREILHLQTFIFFVIYNIANFVS